MLIFILIKIMQWYTFKRIKMSSLITKSQSLFCLLPDPQTQILPGFILVITSNILIICQNSYFNICLLEALSSECLHGRSKFWAYLYHSFHVFSITVLIISFTATNQNLHYPSINYHRGYHSTCCLQFSLTPFTSLCTTHKNILILPIHTS